MKQLNINQSFKDLIPPLTSDELQGLTKSLQTHGHCRETLKIWKGTIIDGHNRYAICQEYGIPFTTQEMRFASKKDAELWIIKNQLGRRNLTNAARIKLALRKEALLREKARKNRSGHQNNPINVRKAIASEAGVSERTVYKYMKICELGTPEIMRRVESGEDTISKAYREASSPTGEANTGLEITTRTVEVFAGDDTPNINNPYYEKAVYGNIAKLATLYCFVFDNNLLLNCEGDMPRINKKLIPQLREIRGVMM